MVRVVGSIVLLLATPYLSGQEPPKPLNEIQAFVNGVCPSPGTSGHAVTASAQADAEAKIPELFKKLVELGVKIGVAGEVKQWQGLVQADLASALKSTMSCRENLARDLIQRLLAPDTLARESPPDCRARDFPTPPQPEPKGPQRGFQDGFVQLALAPGLGGSVTFKHPICRAVASSYRTVRESDSRVEMLRPDDQTAYGDGARDGAAKARAAWQADMAELARLEPHSN